MRVLVIAPHYTTFIKGQVDAIAKHVDSIDVMIPYNYLAEISNLIPFNSGFVSYVRRLSRKKIIDLNTKPENVKIHLIRTPYIIPSSKNLLLGDRISRNLKKYVEKKKMKFDIIHAHFTWPYGYAAVRLGKTFDVPVIVTGHGYDVYDLPFRNKKWSSIIKFLLTNVNYIITVSKSNYAVLTNNLQIPEDKISVIPNGFDSNLFRPMDKFLVRKRLDLPENVKIILNVVNLVPVKGHKYLIKAVNEIVKFKKDILCIIVGSGPLEKKLKKQITRLNLERYVKLVGGKPHNEIPLWMNASDLFVLPSLSEGNPTVMFEALGVGLPFVGTKVGGIPEIITSEDYGLLVEPADSYDLKEKILIALEKEWDRGKIRKYAEKFTWENIVKDLVKIYREINLYRVSYG